MSWFSDSFRPPTLDQDFIQRYWDLSARVDSLESQLDGRLEYLEKTYKRVEQSERRLDEKLAKKSPCEDDEAASRPQSVFDIARRAQSESV